MEKQHLKRLGYGFSALVMGLAAVSFYPVGGAVATTGGDWCTEEDTSPCFVSVVAPEDLEYVIGDDPLVFTGSYNGDLVISVDGEYLAAEDFETENHKFTVELEFDEMGPHAVEFFVLEKPEEKESFSINVVDEAQINTWTSISKIVSTNTPVTVEANVAVAAYDEEDNPVAIYCGAGYEYWCFDMETEEENTGHITLTKSGTDQYVMVINTPGKYTLMTIEKTGNNYLGTEQNLTAIEVETSAAETVTDLTGEMSDLWGDTNKAGLEYREAIESEDEEKIAAAEEKMSSLQDQLTAMNLKMVNAFGEDINEILGAAYHGAALSTEVKVESITEVDEDVKAALLENLDVTYAGNVSFYDIDVVIYADGEEIGTLKELTNDQVIVIDGFSAPTAGFKRVFQVVRYHTYYYYDENGEMQEGVEVSVIEDVDFDPATGTISFASDKFSTFAVGYKDVLAASVDTGVFTGEGASATSSAIISVVAAAAIVALASAVKFAKRS